MTIRLKLDKVLEARGMTTRELAKKASIAYNTALGLHRGSVTQIRFDTLDRICTALEITPADIFEFAPPEPTTTAKGRGRQK